MKKFFTFFWVIAAMTFSLSLSAQDTLDVPNILDDETYGALNRFIENDSMRPANRVYRLATGKLYFLSGGVKTDFHLRLVADKPINDENRPPVILSGIGPNGETAGVLLECYGDATIKDVYINCINPQGEGRAVVGVRTWAEANYIFDNVIFEGTNWFSVVTWTDAKKLDFKNCYFRNSANPGGLFNGRGAGMRGTQHADTVTIENCTFFNLNSFAFGADKNEIEYFSFQHNTIVNTLKWPIQMLRETNSRIASNIFYNAHAMGETVQEYQDSAIQDANMLPFGIYNMQKLPVEWADSLGYTDANRRVELLDNDYFYSAKLQTYWTENNVIGGEFMNSRTQGWFDDDANHPLLAEFNTMNMDPMFINEGNDDSYSTIDSLIKYVQGTKFRDTNIVRPTYWGYEPVTTDFNIEWPLPENLKYTNANLLYAAPGACPLGDLNWFPERKEFCITVATHAPKVSEGLSVEQNTPNPFKGQTTIAYTLADASKVKVNILDLSGRVIATLVNENQAQGRHTIEWNAKNQATGTYLYQITTNNALVTRKLELIK